MNWKTSNNASRPSPVLKALVVLKHKDHAIMSQLFSGPYFDYVMSQEPLRGAEYFKHGSSAMLFQRDGNLYRLSTDGKCHVFLAEQSAKGNESPRVSWRPFRLSQAAMA